MKSKGGGCSRWEENENDGLERESLASLKNTGRSDRRQLSVQERELLYAERASRGYRIYGVSSNSKR